MINRVELIEKRLDQELKNGAVPTDVMSLQVQDVDFLIRENKELHHRLITLIKKKGLTKEDEDKATLVKYFNDNPKLLEVFNKVMDSAKT